LKDLAAALAERCDQQLYRRRRLVESAQGPEMVVDGRRVTAFCSNDYLGLANHPDIAAAFKRGIDNYGSGSGSAHLVNGHSRAHHALEEALADFTHRPRALLFSTGYMANLGGVTALIGRGDAVFEDRLNHASLLDAGLLSGARFKRYNHADSEALDSALAESKGTERLVVSDGVFSMDGDMAPVTELATVAKRHDAWLMIDDAHGLGVVGANGGGVVEQYGLGIDEVPILVGTLGKAFGTAGAFVAGSEELIETLIQSARSYIYTTAQPPAVAVATLASLRLAREESWRREKLQSHVARFRSGAAELGLELMESTTPIQPILLGSAARAVAVSEALWQRNILVTAIRPPTVPEGSARLRVTLSAAHNEAQLDRLLSALGEAVAEVDRRG